MNPKGPSKPRFDSIFTEGLRESGRNVRVISTPGAGLVGITTSKKIGCHAARNRQKRKLREAVRQTEIGANKNRDWIILGQNQMVAASVSDLATELGDLASRLRARWESESACG